MGYVKGQWLVPTDEYAKANLKVRTVGKAYQVQSVGSGIGILNDKGDTAIFTKERVDFSFFTLENELWK